MNSPIRKRRVFYVSGFDPRGAVAYHRMFSDESRKQAARQGFVMRVGDRVRSGSLSSTWRAERQVDAGVVETTFEFLHWDDLVRKHWHRGIFRLYGLLPSVYWDMLFKAKLLPKVFRVSRWPVVTGFAPGLFFLLMPVLALLAGWGAYSVSVNHFPQVYWAPFLSSITAIFAVAGAGMIFAQAFALGWLLRTYAFVIAQGFGRIPELDPRLDHFARRIVEYVEQSDDDEIVVVGHSIGANIAVSAMARALQRSPELWRGRVPVSFLTLGGTIPMLGLMPSAGAFRNELEALAGSEELRWVDVSAYEDAASFPLVNPVVASGLAAGQGKRPLVMDGGFKAMLEPRTYYKAVWNLFRMHFQYLMASERDVPNDYLAVTTDVVAFRERFGPPS